MYRKIDHIGIAVRSIDAALKVYGAALGFGVESVEDVPDQKTRVAMVPIGESHLEFLEAMEQDSPVGRFISKRGEGLHHICFQVDDLVEELKKLKTAGVRLIDETPRTGAGQCLVAFIHPSSTAGVLVELSQPAKLLK